MIGLKQEFLWGEVFHETREIWEWRQLHFLSTSEFTNIFLKKKKSKKILQTLCGLPELIEIYWRALKRSSFHVVCSRLVGRLRKLWKNTLGWIFLVSNRKTTLLFYPLWKPSRFNSSYMQQLVDTYIARCSQKSIGLTFVTSGRLLCVHYQLGCIHCGQRHASMACGYRLR